MTQCKPSLKSVEDDEVREADEEPILESANNSPEEIIEKIGVMIRQQGNQLRRIPIIENKLTEVATKQDMWDDRQTSMRASIDTQSVSLREYQKELTAFDSTVKSVKNLAKTTQAAATRVEKSVRSTLWKAFLATLAGSVAIIIAVVTAAWSTGGRIESLSQRIITEKVLREEQHRTLKSRLDSLPTKMQVITKNQMSKFEQVVKVDEFKLRCSQLDLRQKGTLAMQVKQGRLPSSFLCR